MEWWLRLVIYMYNMYVFLFIQIPFAGATYGPALSEMRRHLEAGVHTINIGGTQIVLPDSTRLQAFSFCRRCYLVVEINSGKLSFSQTVHFFRRSVSVAVVIWSLTSTVVCYRSPRQYTSSGVQFLSPLLSGR